MKPINTDYPQQKPELYATLKEQIQAITDGVPHPIANLANVSALLYQAIPDINWVGFYLMHDGKLVLGPFQGKVACVEIAVGKGGCGTAVEKDEVQLVSDVHAFPGHIACDGASRSEIVLPIHKNGNVVGVLDIDSPLLSRFAEDDKAGLLEIIPIIENIL